MKIFFFIIYNLVIIPFFLIFIKVASFFDKKIKKGIDSRKNWKTELKKLIKSLPNNHHIFLFHVSSVGEYWQALPVIRAVKGKYPESIAGISFFSPSGYDFLKNEPVIDFKCYLPFDTWNNAKIFFKIIKPDIFFISAYDVWPNHLLRCYKEKISAILISATLSSTSKRTAPLLQNFNKSLYNLFSYIFTISEDHNTRFKKIFDKKKNLLITGDTRFDQVEYSSRNAFKKAKALPIYSAKRSFIILGSLWSKDAKVVIPGMINILKKFNHISVLAIPHEPDKKIIRQIEKQFYENGFTIQRYSKIKNRLEDDIRVVIIDVVGILSQIYSIGSCAYIGGSFNLDGVHNVIEPGIMGIPVLFGPYHNNSYDAVQMKKRGGAFEIKNSKQFSDILSKIINSDYFLNKTGNKLKEYVFENMGATDRILKHIDPLIKRKTR